MWQEGGLVWSMSRSMSDWAICMVCWAIMTIASAKPLLCGLVGVGVGFVMLGAGR